MTASVSGFVTAGYERVAEAFERNFEELGEVGAAFSATSNGELVVDLWHGLADSKSGARWDRDTVVPLFSTTKGLVAICVLMLADRGQLDLDAPVAKYWPDFAANGKSGVTVIEVMSHRARLPAVRTRLSEEDLLEPRRLASLLAAQPQEVDPRAAFTYHPMTYGWLCGEIVRRVDGRTVGQFFADEVAEELGLDLWIGIDASIEPRVARLEYAPNWTDRLGTAASTQDGLKLAVWSNPALLKPPELMWNRPAWHEAEIPASNAIGTARSVARLYGCLARGGELDGVRLLGSNLILRARQTLASDVDPLTEQPIAFGIGFQVQNKLRAYGPPPDAFGHSGAGGSIHGAWPRQRVGFSYAMNQLRDDELVDPRAHGLLTALHEAVGARAD